MNDRKQHVIKIAHQLFIDKGYQATSIQDILDKSGISKGTFYNYFSSKSELLIAIFKNLQYEIQQERSEFLIGHDSSDIEVFIKQLAVHMKNNRENKLFFLFNEVFQSKEPELIQFLQQREFREIRWLYSRLVDLFGMDMKPYLFDCTVMFMSMLKQNSRFYYMDKKDENNPTPIIRFCVNRLVKMVEELSESGEQLLNPYLMDQYLPEYDKRMVTLKEELKKAHASLMTEIRENISDELARTKCWEMVDFIQDELISSSSPRKYIVESILLSLKNEKKVDQRILDTYQKTVSLFLQDLDSASEQRN